MEFRVGDMVRVKKDKDLDGMWKRGKDEWLPGRIVYVHEEHYYAVVELPKGVHKVKVGYKLDEIRKAGE